MDVVTCPPRASDGLVAAAHRLLERNTRTVVRAGRVHRFSVPAAHEYPFQWFWDSCFHAIVWSLRDPARAADELRSLLAWQRPSGFIPHVVFWDQSRVAVSRCWHYVESRGIPFVRRPATTEYLQPPLLAQAVERVGGPFAREVLPDLGRYYRYVAAARDNDRDGLVSILCQFESGLDFSPAYDHGAPHRDPFSLFVAARGGEIVDKLLGFDAGRIFRYTDHHVEDVLFNTVFADGLAALARLARAAGDTRLAEWAQTTARGVTAALLERCWDERRGLFFNLRGRCEARTTRRTIVSLLPLLLHDLPPEVAARLVEHLTDRRTFWTPYPVASVPRDDETFRRTSRVWGARLIWRGPASLNTNWFLVQGLRRHRYEHEARELAARSVELVDRGGFNEFFDPLDGTPVGACDFGWATLAADLV